MSKPKEMAAAVVKNKSFITLANKITILRLLLIPAIIILLLEEKTLMVVILLTFSILTDFLDGLAARLRGERTKLGAFLDPLADKLLLTSVFMTLTYLDLLETWMFVVIFSRDLLIVLGWGVIYILTGFSAIKPRWLGKITTGTQMLAVLACIVGIPDVSLNILLWLTIVFTIISAIDYIIVGEKRLGEMSS